MLFGGSCSSTVLEQGLRRVVSEGARGPRQSSLGRRRKRQPREPPRLLSHRETWFRCTFHPGKWGLHAVQLGLYIPQERVAGQQRMEFPLGRISDEKGPQIILGHVKGHEGARSK